MVIRRSFGAICFVIILTLFSNMAAAQTTTTQRPTDGHTPLEIAPGSPAGSYALSDFDSINLFSQSIGFRLPLLRVGGRGQAGYTITLPIERKWRIKHTIYDPSIGCAKCEIFIPEHHYLPESNWHMALKPGFSPGVMLGRTAGIDPSKVGGCGMIYARTLTRLTFVGPDNTEFELHDTRWGGSPRPGGCTTGENRGREFVTADGSSATFIADADVTDRVNPPVEGADGTFGVSGTLYLRDGTRYIINQGVVEVIRDRNGNEVRFYQSVEMPGHPGDFVQKAVDSLGREVFINLSTNEITYKGFGGTPRTLRILYAPLSERLRQKNDEHEAETLKSMASLFPSVPYHPQDYSPQDFNDVVVSELVLPDGRRYGFRYNSYGELSRVELPTGGAFEYDYQEDENGGVINMGSEEYEIFRTVVRKRVYAEGGRLESITTFGGTGAMPTVINGDSAVRVDQIEPNPGASASSCAQPIAGTNYRLISSTIHYFHGVPGPGLFTQPTHYTKWDNGKEYKTETYACDGVTLLRRVDQNWRQKSPVGWWVNFNDPTYFNQRGPEPANDPRLVETLTTLADSGQVSKTTSISPLDGSVGFDQFNNPTDVWEYDYGAANSGSPGPFLRREHTDYMDSTAYTSANGAHLRGLPVRTWVSSDEAGTNTNKVSLMTYGYDEFPLANCLDISGNEAMNCLAISGHDPAYGTNLIARGNQTSSTGFANASAGTDPVKTSTRYDVAGNVVKTINALGRATLFDYGDNFGLPDGEARSNTAPPELAAQSRRAAAFPQAVRDAAGYISYVQYDYYLGRPIEGEDINGEHTVLRYDDPLDRLTLGVRAFGTPAQSQTIIAYNDTDRTITTNSDLSRFNDKLLKSEIIYDGLGRTTQARQYETATQYILTEKKYDALGRAWASSNPYRPASGESPVWTQTTYDALGRVSSLTAPDGSKSYTLYDGARVLATDPAWTQQLSRMDALGRLVEVWEVRKPDETTGTEPVSFPVPQDLNIPKVSAGYKSSYGYDPLGNLTAVTQRIGASGTTQKRSYVYDSLSRLTSATNPESGTIGYRYDLIGNLILKIDSRAGGAALPNCSIPYSGGNVAICHEYDVLNRVKTLTYNDGTPNVIYSYDDANVANSIGRLTSVSKGPFVNKYNAFDEQGRVTSSSQTTDGRTYAMGYEYDLAGHLTKQAYPSGRSVITSYDQAGRINSVGGQSGVPYASSFNYTAHGAVASMKLGNGLTEHTKYNSRLQPTQIGLGTSATNSTTLQLDYTYGVIVNGALDITKNNGDVQSQHISLPGLDVTQSYVYDNLDRLQSAGEVNNAVPCKDQNNAPTDCWRQVYKYDRYGNRSFDSGTSFPALAGNLTDMVNNPRIDPATNRLVEDQDTNGTKDYRYDQAGNVTRNALGQTFAYDAENMQIQFNGGATINTGGADYYYDGEGRRVKTVTTSGTTIFVYDALGRVVAEYSNEAPQPGSGGTKYLTEDNLGSPRVVTDQNKKVVSRHDYAPFGEEMLSGRTNDYKQDSVRQQFTGQERDRESGVDFFDARYFSSTQGRFMSIDPLAASGRPGSPQTWNRYAYVSNNPLKFVDPTGMERVPYMQAPTPRPTPRPPAPPPPPPRMVQFNVVTGMAAPTPVAPNTAQTLIGICQLSSDITLTWRRSTYESEASFWTWLWNGAQVNDVMQENIHATETEHQIGLAYLSEQRLQWAEYYAKLDGVEATPYNPDYLLAAAGDITESLGQGPTAGNITSEGLAAQHDADALPERRSSAIQERIGDFAAANKFALAGTNAKVANDWMRQLKSIANSDVQCVREHLPAIRRR